MSLANIINLAVGVTALIGGLVMLGVALRRKRSQPKSVALLIAGMMLTAFGMFITAFAVVFATGEPPHQHAEAAS